MKEIIKFSELNRADSFARTMFHLDPSILEEYLSVTAEYHSEWALTTVYSCEKIVEYLKNMFAKLKEDDHLPKVELVVLGNEEYAVRLEQAGTPLIVRFKYRKGLITNIDLDQAPKNLKYTVLKEYNRNENVHGDHWSAVMKELTEDKMYDIVNKKINNFTDLMKEDYYLGSKAETCYGFVGDYNEGDLGARTLIVKSDDSGHNSLVSFFPISNIGTEVRMKITDISVWDNEGEAVFTADFPGGDRSATFFVTDYAKHRHDYKVGREYTFKLAAFGMKADILPENERSFSFEGQEAVDFLAKTQREPTYDQYGNIEPVTFNLANLHCYMFNPKWKDESTFQSPIESVDEIDFLEDKVLKFYVNPFGDELGISLPLYCLKSSFEETPVVGEPLRGSMWLTGCLADEESIRKPIAEGDEFFHLDENDRVDYFCKVIGIKNGVVKYDGCNIYRHEFEDDFESYLRVSFFEDLNLVRATKPVFEEYKSKSLEIGAKAKEIVKNCLEPDREKKWEIGECIALPNCEFIGIIRRFDDDDPGIARCSAFILSDKDLLGESNWPISKTKFDQCVPANQAYDEALGDLVDSSMREDVELLEVAFGEILAWH